MSEETKGKERRDFDPQPRPLLRRILHITPPHTHISGYLSSWSSLRVEEAVHLRTKAASFCPSRALPYDKAISSASGTAPMNQTFIGKLANAWISFSWTCAFCGIQVSEMKKRCMTTR